MLIPKKNYVIFTRSIGRQQAKRHAAGEPKTVFMCFLCVQAHQQAVLGFIVADGQLMDLHFLILGNKAQPEPLENGQ